MKKIGLQTQSGSPKSCYYIIKRQSTALSYSETVDSSLRIKHYIVGFRSLAMARRVQYTMSPEPCLRLYRRDFDDITDQVNDGLVALNCKPTDGRVVLDTRAKLHISKYDTSLPADSPLNDGMFHLSEVATEDFLMYPFEKNLGIIMPAEIELENDYEIVFTSSVLESTDSTYNFRKAYPRS